MGAITANELRELLCALGDFIRDALQQARARTPSADFAAISRTTTADTIYAIDCISEAGIVEWFERSWPRHEPVQIVMEGIEDDAPYCFPPGFTPEETHWKCLIDPIDGTRCLMHDKRSAWVLAGIAPQKGAATRLSDILAAAMTELPVVKQWRSDQLSAIRGGGVTATATNVLDGSISPLSVRPSTAVDFRHGFSWLAKYFPEGRTLTAQIEERLWEELAGADGEAGTPVFDDQYLSTGGAFHELITGRDRLSGDLRPIVHACLDLDISLVCHPYDVAAALILQEAGVIYEHPLGGFPDAPLDTTTPITWIGYANATLAAQARPVLQKTLRQFLGAAA